MTIKELKAKYPKYDIIESGYKGAIPYTLMSGITEDSEILGMEIITGDKTAIDITHLIFGGKKRKNKHYDGEIYVWYKE